MLAQLAKRGVEYFLAGGSGTDFPPVIEGYAKRIALGEPAPTPVTVMHETTTVSMAHGYAMVAGKPLFAMVHTIVGTANTVMGMINAARVRAPVVLAAGRTSYLEKGSRVARSHGIHWAQESFDQAGMLREYVKWDYELRSPLQLETVVDRAFAVAGSAPAGPVYLSLSLDVLAADAAPDAANPDPLLPNSPAVANDASLRAAADALIAADNPLIVTSSSGRDPETVAPLVALAEALGIPVVEHWATHLNFPQDHPLHLGYDVASLIGSADVVVVLESDAPWFPSHTSLKSGATVIQVDEDPLHQDIPLRGFPADVTLTGSIRLSLESLVAAVAAAGPSPDAVEQRRTRWSREHDKQRAAWLAISSEHAGRAPMHPAWVSRCISEALQPDDIAVTEYVLEPEHNCFTKPGTYFNHSHAGGLGWAPGAALGAKLAKPDATVVCCVGDGCYNFSAPLPTHYTASSNNLPVLFVVYNNEAWGKTLKATAGFAPDGYAVNSEQVPLCELGASPRYDKVCEAAGGYGERVDDPAELPAAIQRALHAVQVEGRQALLNVITGRD